MKRFWIVESITDFFIFLFCPFNCCKRKISILTRRKTMNMKFDVEMDDDANTELMETLGDK